jgi:hypothetical protein
MSIVGREINVRDHINKLKNQKRSPIPKARLKEATKNPLANRDKVNAISKYRE